MARYNPDQPFWKRAIAGVLDCYFSFTAVGNIVQKMVAVLPMASGAVGADNDWVSAKGTGFDLQGWSAALVIGLVIAYFVVLGRTGGTLFQRLFGFKRT